MNEERFENEPISLNDLSFGKPIAKGSNAVVYAAKLKSTCTNESETENKQIVTENDDDITKFPLALKMMFNYDIQSSSTAILKAMYRETVPAREYNNVGTSDWEME